MALLDRLKEALRDIGYTDDEFHLERTATGKVGGHIVSEAFRGESQTNRQAKLWLQLERRLSKSDLAKIVAILTVTRAETGR